MRLTLYLALRLAARPMDDDDLCSHPVLSAFDPKPVNERHKQFEGMVVWIQLPLDPQAWPLAFSLMNKIRVCPADTNHFQGWEMS